MGEMIRCKKYGDIFFKYVDVALVTKMEEMIIVELVEIKRI